MICYEYTSPNDKFIFGGLKIEVKNNGENYNFPLRIESVNKLSNVRKDEEFLNTLIIHGFNNWIFYYGELQNCIVNVLDSFGNVLDTWNWEQLIHGDSIHIEFYKWCERNKGSKGIAIGVHDGETGEWVSPIIDGLVEGVLIEPTDTSFEKLASNYSDNDCVLKNILVSTDGGEYTFYQGGLGYANSIKESVTSQFEFEINTVLKKSISINDIILECNFGDSKWWLHLDVEGLDSDLLSLDDSIINLPDVIVYENLNLSIEDKIKTKKWLTDKSYTFSEFGWNTIAFKSDNRLSLLVHTHDAYQRFWGGMFYSLDFYWDFDSFPVYFANEEIEMKDIELNCKGILCYPDKRIRQILTGKTDVNGFSDRLINAVERIPTKYVIYMQEDMWLKRSLDKDLLNDLVNFMEENNANCIKIHARPYFCTYEFEKTNTYIKGIRLLKQDNTSLMSHNATIWRKDYLLKYQECGENPWLNEDNGSKRMANDMDDSYHYNINWYCQPGCSDSGEFSPEFYVYSPIIDDMKFIELKYNLKDK